MKCPRKIYIVISKKLKEKPSPASMGAFFFTAKAAASVAAQRNTDRVRDVDDWRVETFVKGD